MKKYSKILLYHIAILFMSFFMYQCAKDTALIFEEEEIVTRSPTPFYNDKIDWDRVDKFSLYDPTINQWKQVELPWRNNLSSTKNIPREWKDPNATSSVFKDRYYARENGWEIVYCNFSYSDHEKYIALYNKYTGILRFFFYTLSTSNGPGTSNIFLGIRINKSSSLFNYTYDFADNANKKQNYASFITTPPGQISGTEFKSVGYQVNTWYGLEIECAYDPSINSKSDIRFDIVAWASNVTVTQGTGVTEGKIEGTIQYAGPQSNLNVNISNLFNNSNSQKSIIANNTGIVEGIGTEIEKGVQKNDRFFTGLWDNIKKNADGQIGSGVKTGINSLLKSGGKTAVKALGGLASSITGIGGSKPSVGKVDLALKSNSKFTFQSETQLDAFGVTDLIIPGASDNPNDMAIYNKPLGVWNLKTQPSVTITGHAYDFYMENYSNFYDGVYYFTYDLNCSQGDLILNDAIKNEVSVKGFEVRLVFSEYSNYIFNARGPNYPSNYQPQPISLMNGTKYYTTPEPYSPVLKQQMRSRVSETGGYDTRRFLGALTAGQHGSFKAIVYLTLVENTTGKEYAFSKWFNVNMSQTIRYNDFIVSDYSHYQMCFDSLVNGGDL